MNTGDEKMVSVQGCSPVECLLGGGCGAEGSQVMIYYQSLH